MPPRLRQIIGKSDLGRSLKTKDAKEATPLYPAWLAAAQVTIERAEQELARRQAGHAGAFYPFGGMTQAEAEAVQREQWAEAWKIAAEDERMGAAESWAANLPPDHPAMLLLAEERARGDQYKARYGRRRRRDIARPVTAPMTNPDAPPVRHDKPAAPAASPVVTGLFDNSAAQAKIAPSTVDQWRSYINHLVAFLGINSATDSSRP
ncbi:MULTISPECIES: DUF6538 domain-containing protein [unclassified Sphingobium]|uniref:DUF6538 domain-containing protein n=1 Tax=unclassified Sphingobium TaxID=2611147 RepID=UPI0035A58776